MNHRNIGCLLLSAAKTDQELNCTDPEESFRGSKAPQAETWGLFEVQGWAQFVEGLHQLDAEQASHPSKGEGPWVSA